MGGSVGGGGLGLAFFLFARGNVEGRVLSEVTVFVSFYIFFFLLRVVFQDFKK